MISIVVTYAHSVWRIRNKITACFFFFFFLFISLLFNRALGILNIILTDMCSKEKGN